MHYLLRSSAGYHFLSYLTFSFLLSHFLLPHILSLVLTPSSQSASVMTKASVSKKDERDMPMRRVRHRDAKRLQIALTVGLGWDRATSMCRFFKT